MYGKSSLVSTIKVQYVLKTTKNQAAEGLHTWGKVLIWIGLVDKD